MNLTTVLTATQSGARNAGNIGGYRVSKHAKARMAERRISVEEVSAMFESDKAYYEVNSAGIDQYRGSVRGRPIRVTVNELSNVIVTVAAPAPGSLFGVSVEYGL